MKRILDEAHERARRVLEGDPNLLEAIAQALLERETLGRKEVDLLARGESLPPLDQRRAEIEAEEPKPQSEQEEGGEDAGAPGPQEKPRRAKEEEDRVPETVGEAAHSDEEAPVSSPVARLKAEEPDPDATRG